MRMWNTEVLGSAVEAQVLQRSRSQLLVIPVIIAAVAVLLPTGPLFGQNDLAQAPPAAAASSNGFSQAFQSPFQPGQAHPSQQEARDPWKFEGRLHLQKGTSEGYLVLQMDLDQGHYIYSVSPEGSPAPTKISVVKNPAIQTRGDFAPNVQPEVNENDPVFQRRIEKHKGRVQFFIPCQLDARVDFQATGMPVIEFNGQVCSTDGVCIPINGQKIAVTFAGFFERANQSANKAGQPAANGEKQPLLGR